MSAPTLYDVLQVSRSADPAVIEAAYLQLKQRHAAAQAAGDADARNRLIFVEEAFAVLGNAERRALYNVSLDERQAAPSRPVRAPASVRVTDDSVFLAWWGDGRTAKLLVGFALFGALFAGYRFLGQSQERKLRQQELEQQARREAMQADIAGESVANEGRLVDGGVDIARRVTDNQSRQIDRSFDAVSRQQELQRQALEIREREGEQRLEMQRQALEEEKKQRAWQREQSEKRDQSRQANEAANRQKRALCDIYYSERRYAEARSSGC